MQFFPGKKEKSIREEIEKKILEKYNIYYRLAYSYVHNPEDAGDIVQNGAYKALKGSMSLKNPEYAATWVYRIMLNECFRFLREGANASKTAPEEELAENGKEDRYADIDLERALDSLPEKEKAVILLKYFEDKTLEEAAEILEENVNTVKSRLYRSIRKLRAVLSEEGER